MGNSRGRRAIFRPKDGKPISGLLTTPGTELFEQRRQELSALAGWSVSDVDVVESFLRGMEETRKTLEARPATT